jgi:hypothetical protein
MVIRVGIVVLSLALIAGDAQAAFLAGNDLYEQCTSSDFVQQIRCMSYVEGVTDYLENVRHDKHLARCVPDGTTLRQLLDAVVNYLRDQPQDRTYVANVLVVLALSKAWQCQWPDGIN